MGKISKKPFCIKLKKRKRFRRLLGKPGIDRDLRSGVVILKPSEAVGEHETTGKEEVIIVLKGKVTVYYGKGGQILAQQGSFVYIPPNTLHNLKNTGKGILQYVYVTNKVA